MEPRNKSDALLMPVPGERSLYKSHEHLSSLDVIVLKVDYEADIALVKLSPFFTSETIKDETLWVPLDALSSSRSEKLPRSSESRVEPKDSTNSSRDNSKRKLAEDDGTRQLANTEERKPSEPTSSSLSPSRASSNTKSARQKEQMNVRSEANKLTTTLVSEPVQKEIPKERNGWRWRYSPSWDGIDSNLFILLHGLGDNEEPFHQFAQKVKLPQTATLSLRGTQLLPFDLGYGWIESFTGDGDIINKASPHYHRQLASLKQCTQQIIALLEYLHEDYAWSWDSIFLFGFSQGGSVVLDTIKSLSKHQNSKRVGGAIVVAGEELEDLSKSSPEGNNEHGKDNLRAITPLLLIHGANDSVVPLHEAQSTVDKYRQLQADTDLYVVKGKGHAMISSEAETRKFMEFYAKHCRLRNPRLEEQCIPITSPEVLQKIST